jgi:CMP-N-acetylneuraminic acid synthetase
MPRIVAIVPMRHTSERVPGKNYRPFAGRPLYHHIIETLLQCESIEEIVIDTDSSVILEEAERRFPTVRLIERPTHLRSDTMSMNEVLLHGVRQIEADYYLQTHSTNPLLRAQTITSALEKFLAEFPMYDTMFGVTRLQVRLYDQLANAINHNPAILLRTQDLPPVQMENSNLYLFTKSVLEDRHNRIGERPLMYEIEAREAWDIDDEFGFLVGEFLHDQMKRDSGT